MPKQTKKAKETTPEKPTKIKVADPIERLENRIKKLERRHYLLDEYVDGIAIEVIEGSRRVAFVRGLTIIILVLTAATLALTMAKVLGWL